MSGDLAVVHSHGLTVTSNIAKCSLKSDTGL